MIALLLFAQLVAPQTLADTVLVYKQCYQYHMGLQRWEITLNLGDFEYEGATEADPSYLTAEIDIDTTELRYHRDLYIRRLVVHELVHVLLWELTEPLWEADTVKAERNEERLATEIERWEVWPFLCQIP